MIRLNKNKNIGNVIYVVEGAKEEQYILKRIFNELLDYELLSVSNKGEIRKFRNRMNKYSKITIITSKHPQIVSLERCEDYFANLYIRLAKEENIDVENSAIYYIFDRDNKSNPKEVINRLISKFKNPYDNNNEMNGVLLLSYPAIEAFYLNSYYNKKNFNNAKEMKRYVRHYHLNAINEDGIKKATEFLLDFLYKRLDIKFDLSLLEDYKNINELIFKKEENYFINRKVYLTLSTLVLSLIDLGVIEVLEN